MHGLGRIVIPDPRDDEFPMAKMLRKSKKKSQVRNHYSWWKGNQGGTSECVIYALTAFFESSPVSYSRSLGRYRGKPRPLWNMTSMYHKAQELDPWPGISPVYEGTTVRAGVKLLQKLGFVGEYTWEFKDLDVFDRILMERGPVVVGTNWDEGMSTPDSKNFIAPGGENLGGHAYLVNGISIPHNRYRIQNSWGTGWGDKGFAYIRRPELHKLLLEEGGEMMFAEKLI